MSDAKTQKDKAAAEAAEKEAAEKAAEKEAAEKAAAEAAEKEAAALDDLRAGLSPDQALIEFTAEYEVQNEHRGTDKATIYRLGDVVAVPQASALRFQTLGVAVPV